MAGQYGPELPTFTDLVSLRAATDAAARDLGLSDDVWRSRLAGEMSAVTVARQQSAADPAYQARLDAEADQAEIEAGG